MLTSGCGVLYAQTASTDSIQRNKAEAEKAYHPADLYPSDATDLSDRSSTDIATPDNIKTEVTYDPQSGNYKYETKVGDESLGVPFYLQSNEYADYMAQQSLKEYYKQKNAEAQKSKHQITLTDMKFDIGPADRVFGPGGVQLKLQGSAELDFGLNFKKLKDPSLSERSQNPAPTFDFDEKIQLSVDGSVGDKLKFGLNYNTEATFDYDQSLIKLQYEGKEDDIIKKIEAGNVSMPLSGSLITGNTSLFGIRADLQFGKLSINAVVSQQESDGKTVNTSGAQTTKYEIRADNYDENRHFFLTHFFRDHYDEWVKDLPNVTSGVLVGEIEVWVTNKNSVNYNNVTNVVGFVDLGEPVTIYNPTFHPATGAVAPDNDANDLYQRVVRDNGGLPDIYTVDAHLMPFNMSSGVDYSKIEGARKLESTEYTLNNTLGFISLKTALNNDEVLCVAFQYTYKGKVYTVGELSKGVAGDRTGEKGDQTRPLALKMLRTTESSPELPTWNLMMKNIYSLGAYQVQQDKFRLNIMYRNDSTGIDLRYIDEGPIARTPLIRVLNLDNLDVHNQKVKNGDGVFDFVEGYTVLSSSGKIIFPVLEPFGSYMANELGNDPALVKKYCFQELYDSTLVVAQELAEKNKFYLTGEYRASSGSEIRLNAMNIPKGSVKVTAGGRELVENVDYTVDYMMGVVNILNQDIIELGTPVSVTLESQSLFNTTRKSLIGTHLNYAINDHFNVGGTFMLLTEKPLTEKSSFGNDPVSNIMWGLDASYRNQFQSITDFFNKIPILNLKQPSTLAINAEFAQMVPGTAAGANGKIYVDDFESTKIGFDVRYAYNWRLASTPSRFEESKLSNNVEYGKNRAHIAWYYIDNMFNRSTATTPSYLTRDKEQLSNHFVREIAEQEIFPNKELVYGQSSYIQTLDISYYPSERGQYNINSSSLGSDGRMKNRKDAWGGIMRRLETTDFETNNIEYLEFWLMDPFVYNDNGQMKGGDLYINLGNISEDILKDGYKSYENGLPVDGSATNIVETVWGRVSTKQSVNYAFETSSNARKYQDVGLNGLSTEEEKGYGAYKKFVDEYSSNLDPAIADSVRNDKFSPVNDPAGDNFHHYRGDDYDAAQTSILDRYKHYNGTEGNSPEQSGTSYTTAATNNPDVEDINLDNTMNDAEKYFEYRVSLRPSDMRVGENFITDRVTSSVTLKNGKQASVNWYQFKIPITDSEKYTSVNGMKSFKSIRFMRMYLTGFEEETHLRFATLELVKGEWRTYNQVIDERYYDPSGMLESSSVSIEDNASKRPVNYVLPPGVKREVDPSQQQVRQENEQSMALLLHNLYPKDSRAVYKRLGGYDMNLYGRMQMFVHAEAFEGDTHLGDQDLSLFVRIGTDYKNNYYEYEVPLTLTQPGNYSNNNTGDRALVWPENNMIDFPLSILTNLKKQRNREKGTTGTSVSNMTEYSGVDPEKPNNRIVVKGNPNLADVEVVMIGIRNNSRQYQSAEIWVDELLLTDIDQSGGVAALANVDFSIADFISLSAAGRIETMGFGQIEQTIAERRQEDYYQYNINAGIDLGKLIPEKANAVIPIKVSYSNEIQNPKYNPLDKDILLKDALAMEPDRRMRDSILRIAQTVYTNTSLSIPNIRFGYTSKNGPELKATTLAEGCYHYMFAECSSLTQAPDLPAERIVKNCYESMFYKCTSIEKAPVIKAKKLAPEACEQMFYGCSKLNYVEVNFDEWDEDNYATYEWLEGVAANGTYKCSDELEDNIDEYDGSTFPESWIREAPIDIDPENPVCFTSNADDSDIMISKKGSPTIVKLAYSFDGETWFRYRFDTSISLAKAGDSVIFCNISEVETNFSTSKTDYYKFVSTKGNLSVSGDVTSLLCESGNIENLPDYTFANLFNGNTFISDASKLELPSTDLGSHCYYAMFDGCSSLTTAPDLPAEKVAESCYANMFEGCAKLAEAPELNAVMLEEGCFAEMFKGCTSLVTAPVINALSLANASCFRMFSGCEKLNHIEVSFKSWNLETYDTYEWLAGVSATGTFKCPDALFNSIETRDGSTFPEGWNRDVPTDVDEIEADEDENGSENKKADSVKTVKIFTPKGLHLIYPDGRVTNIIGVPTEIQY